MKRFSPAFFCCAVCLWLFSGPAAKASASHVWYVTSPDHEQTFVYGSEQHRAWIAKGPGRHLALALNFTNDPYVDRDNPRQYDDFLFNFPQVTLGSDRRTFYYHASEGRAIPVAVKRPDFLGVDEIRLLPGSHLVVKKPHGYLSLTLVVRN